MKLRKSNFLCIFTGSIGLSEQKSIKNVGKSSCGRRQGLSKIFRAAIYRAHRAVVFAIAQLSCSNWLLFKINVLPISVAWKCRLLFSYCVFASILDLIFIFVCVDCQLMLSYISVGVIISLEMAMYPPHNRRLLKSALCPVCSVDHHSVCIVS